jgi:hypothetical protein
MHTYIHTYIPDIGFWLYPKLAGVVKRRIGPSHTYIHAYMHTYIHIYIHT